LPVIDVPGKTPSFPLLISHSNEPAQVAVEAASTANSSQALRPLIVGSRRRSPLP
jgi:hypothetical protein